MRRLHKSTIKVEPPGPRAKSILERSDSCLHNSRTQSFPGLVISEAKGSVVKDPDGNAYLDFNQSLTALGHSNPVIVSACRTQIERFVHTSGAFAMNEPAVILAEHLQTLVPVKDPKIVFCTSGTEACECAMDLVRHFTGRWMIGSFYDSTHGVVGTTLNITGDSKVRKRIHQASLDGILLPYPNAYRCPLKKSHTEDECADDCIAFLEETLESIGPEQVASIFIEPIQVPGGMNVPPTKYLNELAKLCKHHKILLTADEVWTGFGRTGKLFASEYFGITPDIICMGKTMGFGFPIGGLAASSSLMSSWKLISAGRIGSFGSHATATSITEAGIKLILHDNLLANVQELGKYIKDRLEDLYKRYDEIGNVRSVGLLSAVELVKDRRTATPDKEKTREIQLAAFRKGLLILRCGRYDNVIRFAPPITVSREEVDEALTIFESCVSIALS